MKIAIGHGKKNYVCEIDQSCSFAGSEFVSKAILDIKYNIHLDY